MENTQQARKFKMGDAIALGDGFPEFQRGWKAHIVGVYDHVSEFDGSPMYHVRFFQQGAWTGKGGWLNVSELSVVPVDFSLYESCPSRGALNRAYDKCAHCWHVAA